MTPRIFVTACVLSLALAGGAFAQNRDCAQNDRACLTQPKSKAKPRSSKIEAKGAPVAESARRGPAVGDSAKGGKPFRQADNSRFARPGQGREYRVVEDRVVLVDSNTLKIVAVMGLLSALSN